MNRREFLTAMIGGGIFLITGCGEKIPRGENIHNEVTESFEPLDVKHLRQLITSDPSTTRRIMFQSDEPLQSPTVELKLGETMEQFPAVDCTFTDDDHVNRQYGALIEGLEAGVEYQYRAADGNRKTDWYLLETPRGSKFKALIFPDSQCANYDVWAAVAKSAIAKNPDAEFFVNLGDIVDNGEDWTQWRAWFDGAPFIKAIPFVPVMGNHETYSRQWEVREPIAYLNYFDVPTNGSSEFNRYYYSFDWKGAHFMVLNTEPFDGLIDEQKNWLRRDSESNNRKWKIVLMHRDVLQYRINGRPERQEGFSPEGLEFMPLFDELGIDLVLTGHLHTYRNRGRIFNFEKSPRGAVYILTGIAGDVRYPGLWIDHALDEVIAPQPETDNFLTLEVDDKSIEVCCFLPNGTVLDRVVIEQKT